MKSTRVVLLFATLFPILSCSLITEPRVDGKVEFHPVSETFIVGEPIRFQINNLTHQNVLLEFCGGNVTKTTQRYTDDGWENYSSTICLMVFAPEYVEFVQKSTTNFITQNIDKPGKYRIKMPYKFSGDLDTILEMNTEFVVE